VLLLLFFLMRLELHSGLHTCKAGIYCLSHTSPLHPGYVLEMGSHDLSWSELVILLVSASQIARIIGVSHQRPATIIFLILLYWQYIVTFTKVFIVYLS
jgi:hypothetical protein